MEDRTCKVCGKTLPLDQFPKLGKYHRYVCKKCQNEKVREWRKAKIESGTFTKPFLTPEERERRKLKEGLAWMKRRMETGTTYRNDKEAERARAYQREYGKKYRDDQHRKEVQRRGNKNYLQRKRMKEQVTLLDEFFSMDNDLNFD